jgi:hypothetical protein
VKKKGLIGIMALLFIIGSMTVAIAAPVAPPSDLPTTHWAYEAVTYLAKTGIIDGYGDGKFHGDKVVTRYEMAQVVYKAMLNGQKADIVQKAVIDKLAAEFAMELTKIEKLERRVEKLENKVAFDGEIQYQYKMKDPQEQAAKTSSYAKGQYRLRLNAKATIDENTVMGFRLANPAPTASRFRDSTSADFGDMTSRNDFNSFKVDRVFVTHKIGDLGLTIGRQAMEIDPEDILMDSKFFSYDGIKLNWKWDKLKFDVKRGRFAKGVTDTFAFDNIPKANFADIDMNSATVSSQSGKWDWGLGYLQLYNTNPEISDHHLVKYYFGNVGYLIDNKWSLATEWGKNVDASNDGKFWALRTVVGDQKLVNRGQNNLTLLYIHAGNNSIVTAYTAQDQVDEGISHAYTTTGLAYRYAFSKNTLGKIELARVNDQIDSGYSYSYLKFQITYKF